MYSVQVAADIFQVKCNFELQFPSRPSLQELIRATEAAYSNEISLRRPERVPPHSFHIAKIKFYDEERGKWSDLLSEAQLTEFTQCYAFQPENQWHKESQREIPAATRPPTSGASSGGGHLQPALTSTGYQSNTTTSYQAVTTNASARSTGGGAVGGVGSMSRTTDATQEEKVRTVFQEFDHKNNRMIDMDDLMQGFRTLGLDFTSATMNDLFQKGDTNHDGRISLSEFERFAGFYPIMIDCLFYRTKAFWDDQNMQREIDAEGAAVRDAQSLVSQAEQQHKNASQAVEDATNGILAAENDIKDRQSRVRDLAKDLDQAQRDKERSMKEKFERENEVVQQKDRERQARQLQQDAARDVEQKERRSIALGSEAQKADEKVKALQAQLLEAQRLADRAITSHKQSQQDTEESHRRAQESARSADTIQREMPKFEELHRQAEQNANISLERVREVEMLSRDSQRDIDDIARRRDGLERQMAAAKDHEANMAQEFSSARRNAEERERLAKQREAELLEQQRQRQLLTAQERQLIEQELKLREQRDSLEEKESVLRTEATSFLANLRTQSQQNNRSVSGSYVSRDASAAYGRNDSGPYGARH